MNNTTIIKDCVAYAMSMAMDSNINILNQEEDAELTLGMLLNVFQDYMSTSAEDVEFYNIAHKRYAEAIERNK